MAKRKVLVNASRDGKRRSHYREIDVGAGAVASDAMMATTRGARRAEEIVPQVEAPETIMAANFAVAHGATTQKDLAEALNVTTQHASYLTSACYRWGLMDRSESDREHRYTPTTLGNDIASKHSTDDQMVRLAAILRDDELVQSSDGSEKGEEEFRGYAHEVGLTGSTVDWRYECHRRLHRFSNDMTVEHLEAARRTTEDIRDRVAVVAQRRLEAELRRKQIEEANKPVICTSCYMVKPKSGICNNCD